MSSVVVIHAPEDALPARALAEKLRQSGFQVTLEHPPGEPLRQAAALARVSVALWSPNAVQNAALIEDVTHVRASGQVIHASMQNAPAPAQFGEDRAVNLTGWRGEDAFQPWRELAQQTAEAAGVTLPAPRVLQNSGFFQPGRAAEEPGTRPATVQGAQRAAAEPPQPKPQPRPQPQPAPSAAPPAEPKRGGGGMLIGALVVLALAAAGAGGFYFWRQTQSTQHAAQWEEVDRNDPQALRAFIAGDPGAYRGEAQAALAELEERSYEAASDADTIEALEAFLRDFPSSEHALRVRGHIAELEQLEANAPPETPQPPLLEEPGTDPDLLPPGTLPPAPAPAPAPTPPEPAPQDESGGPAPITPPAE